MLDRKSTLKILFRPKSICLEHLPATHHERGPWGCLRCLADRQSRSYVPAEEFYGYRWRRRKGLLHLKHRKSR